MPFPAPRPSRSRMPTLGRRALLGMGVASGAAMLAACSPRTEAARRVPLVVVGCYALEYIARVVAGDHAEVLNLAEPGQEPHDIELSLAQTATIERAAVIVQIPGFQGALDDVISARRLQESVLDVSDVVHLLPAATSEGTEDDDEAEDDAHEHGALDPHFWLDPTLLAAVGTALGRRLGAALSARSGADASTSPAEGVARNARRLAADLAALDAELAGQFAAVPGARTFVTGHAAFAYLARRYDLRQVSISGIDPETEPSPQRLLALQRVIQEEHVSTVFFEESASPKVAETLARNVGVSSAALDTLETQLDPGRDYPTVMRSDAQALIRSWS